MLPRADSRDVKLTDILDHRVVPDSQLPLRHDNSTDLVSKPINEIPHGNVRFQLQLLRFQQIALSGWMHVKHQQGRRGSRRLENQVKTDPNSHESLPSEARSVGLVVRRLTVCQANRQ